MAKLIYRGPDPERGPFTIWKVAPETFQLRTFRNYLLYEGTAASVRWMYNAIACPKQPGIRRPFNQNQHEDGQPIFNVSVPSIVGRKVYSTDWQRESFEELKKFTLAEPELPSEKEMRKAILEKWNSLTNSEKMDAIMKVARLANISKEEVLGHLENNLEKVYNPWLEKLYIHFIKKK